jgi:arylsulfatase A-like enzyme
MPHHIVLISLDALRPDRLGFLGNPQPVSSNLDRIARESVVFHRATSPTTWTLPGHMSMLTGLEPLVHGCVSACHRYPPETLPFPLVFELAAEAGYAPLAVTGGGYMEGQFGFGRGVERVEVILPIALGLDAVREHMAAHERTLSFFHTYTVHDYPRVATRPGALELARASDPDYAGFFPTDRDFHALLNAMSISPEVPEVSERDIAFLAELYGSALRSADAALGGLFKELDQDGILDDTTLIVTSDHGESLGELHCGRRYWSHGGPPYQEQLLVPLIIRPGAEARGVLEVPAAISEPVSLVDLVPTILDLAGVPYSRDQFDGSSLVDLCLGQVSAFETRSLTFHSCEDASDRYLDPRLFGTALTWKGSGKLHYNHRTGALREYYLLDRDPWETKNRVDDLSQDELRRIDEFIAAYWEDVDRRALHPPAAEIEDPVVLERLAQLGYIEEP